LSELKDFSKKLLKGIQIVNSEGNDLIAIKYKKISKLKHYPKGGNTKVSPMLEDWECELVIQFDQNNISPNDLVNLLNYAGFYYGIGIWAPRARCGGKYGMYEVKVKWKQKRNSKQEQEHLSQKRCTKDWRRTWINKIKRSS